MNPVRSRDRVRMTTTSMFMNNHCHKIILQIGAERDLLLTG